MARIPLRYTFRNLLRRKTRTLLTLCGISLVVAAVVFMAAFSRSLTGTCRQTGDHDNMVIISKKAQTFALSSIAARECDQLRFKLMDEAATYDPVEGMPFAPLISPEVYIGLNVEVPGAQLIRAGMHRGVVHGVDPEMALAINRSVSLTEGSRLPQVDNRELLIGENTATRLGVRDEDLAIGAEVRILNMPWTVVGKFKAEGTLMGSEIWAHVEDLRLYLKRQDYSFIRVKLADPTKMAELCNRISIDEQFEVRAHAEQDYFADFARGFDHFKKFAHIVALILIMGGMIAGMNTMYTAVLGRVREIGTLQVIGFSRASVLRAILTESLLISAVSGVIGCGIGYLANDLPMKIPMAAFRVVVDWPVFGWAMTAALIIGLAGAYVPARRALKLRMVDAVRYQ